MAVNPMKRRARNSFLIGFLVALIVMALVVILILYKMQELKNEHQALLNTQKLVYVTDEFIGSGTEVTISSFTQKKIQTSIQQSDFIEPSDFQIENSDGSITDKIIQVRTDIPAGTIITKDLLEELDDKTTDDQRLQEYNMIVLPTELEANNYIDIRLQLPTGEDYIVVSKKKVIKADASTIWLNMYEEEILMLSNAIVEAYTIEGSKLYATTYTQAGLQEAAQPNYVVSVAVMSIIDKNPNIVSEAREALYVRYEEQEQVKVRQRIDNVLSSYIDSQDASVQSGIQEEISKRKSAREEYVGTLGN